jgi:4a-hydroxytetrahydrobiopterin dehydratase
LSEIVVALHDDHVNFSRIAALAEHALDELEAGRSTDLSLLEDIMRYVTGYPDTHHHPTEDVVFEHLSERAPEIKPDLDAILAEHEAIIDAGRRFLDAIEAAEDDAMVQRSDLVKLGREYLARLQRHMDIEEARLFPAARASLTDADWASVRERVDARSDPLFGPSRDEQYRRLWQLIELHEPKHQSKEGEPEQDEPALADRKCIPCRGGVPPLDEAEASKLLGRLGEGWALNAAGHLERAFAFSNFAGAMAFANRVAEIAEAEAHHPDLYVRWGQCRVEIWTHKIGGLTESDFFLAAKIDRAWSELSSS